MGNGIWQYECDPREKRAQPATRVTNDVRIAAKLGTGLWTAHFRRARRRSGDRSSSTRFTMRCWVGSVLLDTRYAAPRAGNHLAICKGIANGHDGGCCRGGGISPWSATLRISIRPPCDPQRFAPSPGAPTNLSSERRKPVNAWMLFPVARGGLRPRMGISTISKQVWPKLLLFHQF